MRRRGRQQQLEDELRATNIVGRYRGSIICTEQGLLVACDGDELGDEEALAGFASLFDEIVSRGARDLGLAGIDEVTVLDGSAGRLVIRPLGDPAAESSAARRRMFLVVAMDADASWRRNTNRLVTRLREILDPIIAGGAPDESLDS